MSDPTEPPLGRHAGGEPPQGGGYTRPLPRAEYADYPPADPGYADPGYAGPGQPGSGYSDPGYARPGYAAPGYAGYPPSGYPPADDRGSGMRPRTKFATIGVAVLAVCAIGGFYAAYAFTQNAVSTTNNSQRAPVVLPTQAAPSVLPTPEASLSPEPEASEGTPFQDDELRSFAGRAIRNASGCRSEPISSFTGVTEVATCQYPDGFTVRFLKFDDEDARDGYAASVRNGLGGRLNVERDAIWQERRQRGGRFIAGSQNGGDTQYVYWNSDDAPVSGELVVSGVGRREAEQLWRQEL